MTFLIIDISSPTFEITGEQWICLPTASGIKRLLSYFLSLMILRYLLFSQRNHTSFTYVQGSIAADINGVGGWLSSIVSRFVLDV